MTVLGRPATIGDVIAWIFGTPVFLLTLTCFRVPSIIAKFEKMFKSLNAELPNSTKILLSTPEIFWYIAPLIISGLLMYVLLKVKSDRLKVATAILSSLIITSILTSAFVAIYSPILELQKKLS